jgi:hypothetical protein
MFSEVGKVLVFTFLLWNSLTLDVIVARAENQKPAVLLIGAAGFIGSRTLSTLLNPGAVSNSSADGSANGISLRDAFILGVDNFAPGYSSALKRQRTWDLIGEDANFMELEVCDMDEFRRIFERFQFTHVVNLAEEKHHNEEIGHMSRECLHGTLNVIAQSSAKREFSTVYVYLRSTEFADFNRDQSYHEVTGVNKGYLRFFELTFGHVNQNSSVQTERQKTQGMLDRETQWNSSTTIVVADVISAIIKVLSDTITSYDTSVTNEISPVRVNIHGSITQKQTALGDAIVLPCASECASPYDCSPSVYDDAVDQSKQSTRNCDTVYYTVGLHRLQSSLKKVESMHMSVDCCLAYIAMESPLSKREKSTYNGWRLIRLSLTRAANSSMFGPTASARKVSRLPKINPARFFSMRVRYAVYFDSSSTPTLDPRIIESYMHGSQRRASVLMFHHPTLMYYGGSAIRSAMDEAEAALPRSGTPDLLKKQKVAYSKASRRSIYRDQLTYNVMPTALFIIWDLRSKTAHELRCQWFDEYSLWGDRDQVSLFYTIASITARYRIKTDVLQEWIPLKASGTGDKQPHLRLLLGKNENYSPFFIKGEDEEKGYPKNTMNDG